MEKLIPLIEVNITGQLGNQLFQYACARQMQEIYGGEIILNIHELSNTMKNFNLALCDFTLNKNVTIEKEKKLSKVSAEKLYVKIMRKYLPNLFFSLNAQRGVYIWGYSRIYKELPPLHRKVDNIVLNGFWQSEK